MAKIEYSCKRKKDFVTFIAIAMFFAICLFEIYLIVFLRIQLNRENAMAYDVMKQEMLMKTELIRYKTKMANPGNLLQECEIMLATNCLDHVVRFVRKNDTVMTESQIVTADEILFQLIAYTLPWEKNRFLFKQEEFDVQPILKRIEAKIDQAASKAAVQ